MRTIGVEERPQTAMFSVPAIFDTAYRRALATKATAAAIPEQRSAPAQEDLPTGAAASPVTARQ
jgi:hypothetical protein